MLAGCTHHAEPRWLVRALPGAYPEVVYFVPTEEKAIALTIDDGLDPEATVAAALKLLGFAPDPDAVLKDNLARAAALHGLDAEEEEEDEPDEVALAADASVKKKAVSDSV